MADPFKEAMGRAMEPEPEEETRGGDGEAAEGELHSVHHIAHGGKHHVFKGHKGGMEYSEHAAGEGGETCPLCGGSGEAPGK